MILLLLNSLCCVWSLKAEQINILITVCKAKLILFFVINLLIVYLSLTSLDPVRVYFNASSLSRDGSGRPDCAAVAEEQSERAAQRESVAVDRDLERSWVPKCVRSLFMMRCGNRQATQGNLVQSFDACRGLGKLSRQFLSLVNSFSHTVDSLPLSRVSPMV